MSYNGGSGVKRKSARPEIPEHKVSRRKSPRRPAAPKLPKTAHVASKRSKSVKRAKFSRANSQMSLTELQFMAKSRGIPFGGLTKTKLVRKINNYL